MTTKKSSSVSDWSCWTALALFILVLIWIVPFHEPGFNEIQAWAIAKTATLKQMIFYFPHLEGHPPLWFVLLAIPAKLGLSVEWGMKSVACIISILSAGLIIFKAPFQKWVRFLLPFTYFLFFEYSVLSRPYGIIVLALILAAMSFPRKDTHPWPFVLSLTLLALTHAFGLLAAFGLTCAWLVDMKQNQTWKKFFSHVFNFSLFAPLLILLCSAIFTLLCIWPLPDTVAMSLKSTTPIWQQLVCVFLIFPPDALGASFITSSQLIKQMTFTPLQLICGSIAGLLVWGAIAFFYAKKAIKYVVLAYIPVALFAMCYFGLHHLGIMFMIFVFGAWISTQCGPSWWEQLCKEGKFLPWQQQAIGKLQNISLLLILLLSIGATVCSSWADWRLVFMSSEKGLAKFIRAHHLEDTHILSTWERNYSNPRIPNTAATTFGIGTACYLGKNIVANLNEGDPSKFYRLHRLASEQENAINFARWSQRELPDLVLGAVPLQEIYGEQSKPSFPYVLVYKMNSYSFGKYRMPEPINIPVYARKDIAEKYNLPILQPIQ